MMSGPMKALLGALVVAGYQNRDKIGEFLRGLQNPAGQDRDASASQPGSGTQSSGAAEALGPDVINELSAKTGLSRQDILGRLSRELPAAVDDLTPNGRVPDAGDEFLTAASAATINGQTQA